MRVSTSNQLGNLALRSVALDKSNRGHHSVPLFVALFVVLLLTANCLPLRSAGTAEFDTSSTNPISFGIEASDDSTNPISIAVNCSDALGTIPSLFVGHYDVDPTRTGVGLDDTTGTSLMKDVKLGFWRLSIGRWEIFDYPDAEDIEKREYFRGSTFEDASNYSMYCWDHMDEVFKSVLEFNCIPLVCIDYMPSTIANNTNPIPSPIPEYSFPNGIRNGPPRNITIFAEVIKHIVMHYTQGWPNGGGHHYDFQYWEVWNEPELTVFWTGTIDALCDMYGAIAQAIRSIDTTANPLNYKIGGLSFATPGYTTDPAPVKLLLSYCKLNNITLDFLSWHGYPDDPRNLTLASLNMRNELQSQGFNRTLSILAEWGTRLFNYRSYWDSSYYAAFTSLVLSDLENSGSVDFQTHSCIKDREVVNSTGGYWGILSRDPTRAKPTYFVFKAFDMLNETYDRLACILASPDQPSAFGQGVIAGKSIDGSKITLIYSNFNNLPKAVRINFQNLSRPSDWIATCNHYLIDNETDLTSAQTLIGDWSGDLGEFAVAFAAAPYSVHVLRVTITRPSDILTVLAIFSIALIVLVLALVLIVFRARRVRAQGRKE